MYSDLSETEILATRRRPKEGSGKLTLRLIYLLQSPLRFLIQFHLSVLRWVMASQSNTQERFGISSMGKDGWDSFIRKHTNAIGPRHRPMAVNREKLQFTAKVMIFLYLLLWSSPLLICFSGLILLTSFPFRRYNNREGDVWTGVKQPTGSAIKDSVGQAEGAHPSSTDTLVSRWFSQIKEDLLDETPVNHIVQSLHFPQFHCSLFACQLKVIQLAAGLQKWFEDKLPKILRAQSDRVTPNTTDNPDDTPLLQATVGLAAQAGYSDALLVDLACQLALFPLVPLTVSNSTDAKGNDKAMRAILRTTKCTIVFCNETCAGNMLNSRSDSLDALVLLPPSSKTQCDISLRHLACAKGIELISLHQLCQWGSDALCEGNEQNATDCSMKKSPNHTHHTGSTLAKLPPGWRLPNRNCISTIVPYYSSESNQSPSISLRYLTHGDLLEACEDVLNAQVLPPVSKTVHFLAHQNYAQSLERILILTTVVMRDGCVTFASPFLINFPKVSSNAIVDNCENLLRICRRVCPTVVMIDAQMLSFLCEAEVAMGSSPRGLLSSLCQKAESTFQCFLSHYLVGGSSQLPLFKSNVDALIVHTHDQRIRQHLRTMRTLITLPRKVTHVTTAVHPNHPLTQQCRIISANGRPIAFPEAELKWSNYFGEELDSDKCDELLLPLANGKRSASTGLVGYLTFKHQKGRFRCLGTTADTLAIFNDQRRILVNAPTVEREYLMHSSVFSHLFVTNVSQNP